MFKMIAKMKNVVSSLSTVFRISRSVWSKILNRQKKTRVLSIAPNSLKFKDSWEIFCENSTLDGLHLIGGRKKYSDRKFSSVMLLAAMLLAGYSCYDNLHLYLHYNIRTTISYETNTQLSFPALTLCNVNMHKRSLLGVDEFFISYLVFAFAKKNEEIPTIQKELNEINFGMYCPISIERANDVKLIYQTFGQIAKDMVKKCWWNKNEIDCNKQFIKHILDFTYCFTFNQNSSNLESMGSVAPVFGMEGIPFIPKMVSNPQQNLKLLLDTQQEEYCGSPILQSGAGFRFLIHDTHAQTSVKLQVAILLSPGFEYTVTVQAVTYDMRNFSESLGRYISKLYNPMRPESDYDEPSFFMECFALKIWKQCKCVPIQNQLITDTLLKYVGEPTSSKRMRMCDPFQINDFFCCMGILSQFTSSTPNEFCPNCIQKCFETKYEYKLSANRLPRFLEQNHELYTTEECVFLKKL